ncbi:MAG: hypothetical protein RL308_1429 [Bacteroidota bacterium]|jgi:RHS repeat-associated protein
MISPSNRASIRNISDYSPYGVQLSERTISGDGYRYGFNGKEMDNEVSGNGNSYDYGFRIYNPRLGRFLSVDPLTKSYPWYTPYQFAGNKPIWAIDLDGLEEYYTSSGELIGKYGTSTEIRIVHKDYVEAAKNITANQNQLGSDVLNNKLYNSGTHGVFQTADEAATDWGNQYNPNGIQDYQEYGSTLYEVNINGNTYVTYSEPELGGNDGVSVTPEPKGTTPVADIHSHGGYEPQYDNNNFSPQDEADNRRTGLTGYVSTPNGSLKCYDPCTNNERVVNEKMPSDSNDPDRKNNIPADKPAPKIIE